MAAGNLSPTSLAYDAHGNTTLLANQAMTYDVADQHVKTVVTDVVSGSPVITTVAYTRDVSGAIVERSESDGTTTKVYHYTAGAVLDGAGGVEQRTVGLPGGVSVTFTPPVVAADPWVQAWFYPNQHGDVIPRAGGDGLRVGSRTAYDPFGQPIAANGDIGTQTIQAVRRP